MTDLLLILGKFVVKMFSMSAICLFKVNKKALYDFVQRSLSEAYRYFQLTWSGVFITNCEHIQSINPFKVVHVYLLNLLKISVTKKFSDIVRGYRKEH